MPLALEVGSLFFFFGLNNKHVFSTVLKAKSKIKELKDLVSGDALFVEAWRLDYWTTREVPRKHF